MVKWTLLARATSPDDGETDSSDTSDGSEGGVRHRLLYFVAARFCWLQRVESPASTIAETLGCDDQIVRNVIKSFNQRGLAVLKKESYHPHRLRTSIPDEALPQLRDLGSHARQNLCSSLHF